jgi:cytochrome oxidase Cu insertion factor (SCO1/SenC/PrrC family)
MLNSGRRVLLLIAAICILPLVAASIIYFGWSGAQPSRYMNYGELLQTRALPSAVFVAPDGTRYTSDSLRGKWLLVTVQPSSCDSVCQNRLYMLQQVRLAQGQNMTRVGRLWLLAGDGEPASALIAAYPGLMIGRPADPHWLATLPVKHNVTEHVYLIDPHGNLVLRYNATPDPEGVINDLARLLKVSRIG